MRALYAAMGVQEYYLYDPLGEYLRPPFQPHTLVEGQYESMPAAPDGSLLSPALAMRLALVNGQLRFWDRYSGQEFLSPTEGAEAETARANALAARAETEAARARTAAAREIEATARASAAAARETDAMARAAAEATARTMAEQRIAELERMLSERQP